MLLSKTTVVNDGNQIYRKQLLLYFFMHKVSHTQRSPPTTLKFLPLKFLYFQKQKMQKKYKHMFVYIVALPFTATE